MTQRYPLVAIHQPNYFPSAKVLAKLVAADAVVLLDNVQFVRREWQSRSRIHGRDWRPFWLSMPVVGRPSRPRLLDAAVVDGTWRSKHGHAIRHVYSSEPYFREVWEWVVIPVLGRNHTNVADVGRCVYFELFRFLGIEIPIIRASALLPQTGLCSSELLAELCTRAGADVYLGGPGSRRYLAPTPFIDRGIDIVFHDFLETPAITRLVAMGARAHPAALPGLRRINSLDLLCALGPQATLKCLASCSATTPFPSKI